MLVYEIVLAMKLMRWYSKNNVKLILLPNFNLQLRSTEVFEHFSYQ